VARLAAHHSVSDAISPVVGDCDLLSPIRGINVRADLRIRLPSEEVAGVIPRAL
jgi:hypothetical protein